MRALIHNTRIVQIVAEDFPVHKDLHFIDCADDCTTDWTLVDGVPTAPAPKVVDGKQYQRDRVGHYPRIEDQLDMIFHDQVDGTTTFKEAIQAVKDANPKP